MPYDPELDPPPGRDVTANNVYFYTDPMNEDPRFSNLTAEDKEQLDLLLFEIAKQYDCDWID